MSATPTPEAACPPTRRQMQLLGIEHLEEIKAQLVYDRPCWGIHTQGPTESHGRPTLSDHELKALGIQKLPAIDLDETAPFDPEPLFFSPYPIDEVDDFPVLVQKSMGDRRYSEGHDDWEPACTDSSCPGWCMGPTSDDTQRLRWFNRTMCPSYRGKGILSRTDWHRSFQLGCIADHDEDDDPADPSQCFDTPLHYEHIGDHDFYHQYHTDMFFGVCKEAKRTMLWKNWVKSLCLPHMAVSVWDSTRQSSDTLCSEIVAALQVIKFMLRRGKCVDHHTVPALVYSFHHDEFARVTQAHWDGSGLTIRQSRLLDLRGSEPTSDAYLLIRWMANTPRGSTAYELPENALPITDKTPDAENPTTCASIQFQARKEIQVEA